MDRPTRWKTRLTLAIVATLVAAPAHAAAAEPSAGDEYVLDFPGVRQADSGGIAEPSGEVAGSSVQLGTVGETDPPASPLAAAGDAIGSIPASLLVGFVALLGLALLAVWAGTGDRRRGGPR